MKRILLAIVTVFMMNIVHAQEEKLSDMTESQRNLELIEIAKATFQREMPEVYREYGTPTFELCVIDYSPTSYDDSFYGEQYGDIYYVVTFPRNPNTETDIFIDGFACKIHIWNDTKEAFFIEYGNLEGVFKLLCKRDRR